MTRVLIVDDDEGFREALSALLALEGFSVQVATNGREGLALLASLPRPEVVLVDLMMPEMNGWDLVGAMKRDPTLAGIPAAVVSAARRPQDLPASVPVFAKPFAATDLLRFLHDASARGPPAS